MPLRSSLMRSAGKLFGVFDDEDLDLRGKEIDANVPPPPPPSDLSGGTAYDNPGGARKYIRFIANGSLVIADEEAVCDILVIGGGGAGGSYMPGQYAGGGGGAGGVRWCPNITLPIGTYPVQVGEGGVKGDPYLTPNVGGSYPPADNGSSGGGAGASSIFNPGDANSVPAITATGGGGGGYAGSTAAGPGGSAGGGSYTDPPGAKAPYNGNTGGDEPRADPVKEGGPNVPTGRGPQPSWGCCGGGGAGDVNGTLSPIPLQNGVPGITLPGMGSPGDPWLTPAGNVFGGGGGGSSYKSAGGSGEGGPGGGGDANPTGTPGEQWTGGGGGGGGTGAGGNGGDGVIYIATPPANTVNPA